MLVAGHKGLVGLAFLHDLVASGYTNAIGSDRKAFDRISALLRKYHDAKPTVTLTVVMWVLGLHGANSRSLTILPTPWYSLCDHTVMKGF